jgi:glycosyltransferase involved in cell wall biosynthesis
MFHKRGIQKVEDCLDRQLEPSLMQSIHKPKLIVTMACYNRKDKTLKCLRSLFTAAELTFKVDVVLFDDNSSDGTIDAVKKEFPAVQVIRGKGEAYWCRGMNAAMTKALELDFDYLLLLNDDCVLYVDALHNALHSYNEAIQNEPIVQNIIVGALLDPLSNEISYSGFRRTNAFRPAKLVKLLPDPSHLVSCDSFNGNFVFLPKSLALMLGPVDSAFVHQIGDVDYGYRAKKLGANIWLLREPVGECARNPGHAVFEVPGQTLFQRLIALRSPKGLPLRPWVVFMWRYGGIIGLLDLLGVYVKKLLFPRVKANDN